MTAENKFIKIVEAKGDEHCNKPFYYVCNKKSGTQIGVIYHYPHWRQYVLSPIESTVWNDECLELVTAFLKQMKETK